MWSTNTLEPLKGQDLSIADKLLDYGCWCQIRNQSGGFFTGHGTPVDALDLACKSWYQCKACTTIDFSACSPRAGYQIDFHPITQRIDCTSNSSECSVRILLKFRSENKIFFLAEKLSMWWTARIYIEQSGINRLQWRLSQFRSLEWMQSINWKWQWRQCRRW